MLHTSISLGVLRALASGKYLASHNIPDQFLLTAQEKGVSIYLSAGINAILRRSNVADGVPGAFLAEAVAGPLVARNIADL